jgi:imidazolonepropionase-like amidohydrolase
VGSRDSVAIAPGAQVFELSGTMLPPGFINAHVHSADLEPDALRAHTCGRDDRAQPFGATRATCHPQARLRADADSTLPRLRIAGPVLSVIYGLNERVLMAQGPDDARA